MFLKELPDHFRGVHVLAGFADHEHRQVLRSTRPGVPTAVDDVDDPFRSLGAPGIGFTTDARPVVRLVRELGDLGIARRVVPLTLEFRCLRQRESTTPVSHHGSAFNM